MYQNKWLHENNYKYYISYYVKINVYIKDNVCINNCYVIVHAFMKPPKKYQQHWNERNNTIPPIYVLLIMQLNWFFVIIKTRIRSKIPTEFIGSIFLMHTFIEIDVIILTWFVFINVICFMNHKTEFLGMMFHFYLNCKTNDEIVGLKIIFINNL